LFIHNNLAMKRLILLLPAVLALLVFLPRETFSNASQPPIKKTGAPGENSCLECHTGGGGSGNLSIEFNNGLNLYVNGQTYQVKVTVNDNTKTRFGFAATVSDQRDTMSGVLAPINFANTSLQPNPAMTRFYIGHANATTSKTWTFSWTAPPASFGSNQVTFYAAGNAANGDLNKTGDNIYTASLTINRSAVGMEELERGFVRVQPDFDRLQVDLLVQEAGPLTLRIIDLSGRQIQVNKEMLESGVQSVEMPLHGLAGGVYILQISHNGISRSQRFLLTR
jgi:hypothetical protein